MQQRQPYPFAYDPSRPFIQQLSDWVGDVFYELLPEAGFEVRDEQIFMAYQLERAYAGKKTIFAEAGVGTGKTLVYLLYAAGYARYTRKPAIIACADESLIEQLVKPEGDIAKLARHLNLTIDARLAKSPDQYLCLQKLDESRLQEESAQGIFELIYEELPEFVHKRRALQSFYPYGDRKAYGHLTDEQWQAIGWDVFQDCLVCDKRHRCGQTLSRDHYRKSADIIICSHDFYMEHVWTREGRIREGQLPLLPEHSSVVFDEGHLLETAAQKALTYKMKHTVLEEILTRLLKGQIRESLALAIEEVLEQSQYLFGVLGNNSHNVEGSDRMEIALNKTVYNEVRTLTGLLSRLEEELALESGTFSLNEYQLRIVDEHLDTIQRVLGLFNDSEKLIAWMVRDPDADGLTLVVMPHMVREVLEERVFSQNIPVVFSSATLSVEGSFEYVADSLGIRDYLSFSVPSPYKYSEQMKFFSPRSGSGDTFAEKMEWAERLLQLTEGRALMLFSSREELKRFKEQASQHPAVAGMKLLFEGDREISGLISEFQNEERSVLCSVSLWEGLDVPGPSLSNVIVWSLPWPPKDPVYNAKRKVSESPFEEVDLPYMLLRLKQGAGRLIRSGEDRGIVSLLDCSWDGDAVLEQKIREALPEGVEWKVTWDETLIQYA